MERKPMNKKNVKAVAEQISSDEEQNLWENKKLGAQKKHAKKSELYKLLLS